MKEKASKEKAGQGIYTDSIEEDSMLQVNCFIHLIQLYDTVR